MKIGIMNIESGYSVVNLLIYDLVSHLIHDHEVYSIEQKTQVKPLREEDLAVWKLYGGNLVRCFSLIETLNLETSDLSNFDAVLVLGGEVGHRTFQAIKNQLKIKALFIPVSIYNEIPLSKQTLGYDSALNAVVGDIFKIEDSISSCHYEQFRLFGIQVPGKEGSYLAKDVADAMGDMFDFGMFTHQQTCLM
jgi:6-phosphofructokinase